MLSVEQLLEKIKLIDVRSIFKQILISISTNKALFLAVFGYIIVLSIMTILRENTFLTSGFDLGIFNQAFSTTIHQHRIFYETGDISFNPDGNFFGVHFSPILFILLPFYAIYPSPENLLVMQTVILALGALPIYWITKNKLGKTFGFLIALIYLCSPLVLSVNLNDFHLEAFTSTFFLFSLFYLDRERWSGFMVFMILAFSTIEFAPIIGIFVALYAFILNKKGKFAYPQKAKKYIVFTVLISILWLILAFGIKAIVNPTTSPLPSPFHSILQNPTGILYTITNDLGAKLFYIILIFAPLAFLPILAPTPLIMLIPWIGASLLSTYPFYYSIYYQYQGFVIPFIFIALIKSIERINFKDARKIFGVLFVATILFSMLIFSSPERPWNYKLPIQDEHTQALNKILSFVPSNASILTENDLFPHVSGRVEAYMYLPQDSDISPDYILVDIGSKWYTWQQSEAFGDRSTPSLYTEKVLKDGSYGVFASEDGIILLKKGYLGYPVLFVPFNLVGNYSSLTVDIGSTKPDSSSISKYVLFHNETDPEGFFWHGPYANLPPGLYRVTYALKVNDTLDLEPSDQLLTIDITASSGKNLLSKSQIYGVTVPASGQWFNTTLFFGLTIPTSEIEFRGNVAGSHNIYLDYIELEQLSPRPINATETSFNYADFLVDNGSISNGVMTHSNGTGTFWYGPYASLPKGNYIAQFWLKLYRYNDDLLDIAVTSNSGKTLIAIADISSANFTSLNNWQKFEVKFSLPTDSNNLEFSGLNVLEEAQISFLVVYIDLKVGGQL